jgi:hypothetical protein
MERLKGSWQKRKPREIVEFMLDQGADPAEIMWSLGVCMFRFLSQHKETNDPNLKTVCGMAEQYMRLRKNKRLTKEQRKIENNEGELSHV